MKDRIYKEQKQLEEIATDVVAKAQQRGADQVEIGIGKATGLTVKCVNGKQETTTFTKSRELNISVYCNGCKGETFTTNLSRAAVDSAIDAAISIAKITASDPFGGLPNRDDLAWNVTETNKFYPQELDAEHSFALATELEALTMSKDHRIQTSLGSTVRSSYEITVLANSHGFVCGDAITNYMCSTQAVGMQDGKMQQGGSYYVHYDPNKMWSLDKIASEAADSITQMLGARKVATGNYPIIIHHLCVGEFIGFLISALFGSAQYRKMSCLQDSIGKQVTKDWLNIAVDPFDTNNIYNYAVDGEGVRARQHPLITDGVVCDYLLSTYSARKLNMQTNGHAGVLGPVHVTDSWNKQYSYQDLCHLMHRGLVIMDTMGQGYNSVTGDFSFGASGQWIENGEVLYPVDGITIAGNIKDLYLDKLVAIATDYDERDQIQLGSMLFADLKVAGL